MKVLVLNCGSSSIKYKFYEMETEQELASGIVERIGMKEGGFKYKNTDGQEIKISPAIPTHTDGLDLLFQYLSNEEYGVIRSVAEIDAVGHRVVHGGEKFEASVIIRKNVLDEIENCIPLAPLHNPANLQGIHACMEKMPDTPQVAVFDTAFHQTIPPQNYIYPLPYEFYEKGKIRRYGFHGTSHRFVANECAKLMNRPLKDLKIVTCHLGNGSSICAVKNGKSFDTTMGFTPLAGVEMGTRCGDIDPFIPLYLQKNYSMTLDEVDDVMNKQSGFLGVTGLSSDLRDVTAKAKENHMRCLLSLDIISYQVKKYVGAYAAEMNGLDAIVFCGGVGENTEEIREISMKNMEAFGIELDDDRNFPHARVTREISTESSKVKVYIIFTNEEIMIARDAVMLCGK
ncbi:MAG: acetate kinase [Caldisericia bacterium]|nr:acetate kinase [Caldisericia bacterium]MDD4614899.1 acetate kinase [Caldisericia bacterium]